MLPGTFLGGRPQITSNSQVTREQHNLRIADIRPKTFRSRPRPYIRWGAVHSRATRWAQIASPAVFSLQLLSRDFYALDKRGRNF